MPIKVVVEEAVTPPEARRPRAFNIEAARV